jgi:N utilization substance protein A
MLYWRRKLCLPKAGLSPLSCIVWNAANFGEHLEGGFALKSDFLIALTQLAAERHLPKEQVLQAIEVALASAFKKDSQVVGQNISVKLNPNTGEVNVFALKTVVETVEDPSREISLLDARVFKEDAALDDELSAAEPLPHNASRIAAQTAKQVVLQRLREAERERVYEEFLLHRQDIISGVVQQMDSSRNIIIDIGRAQAVLPPEEQAPTERYKKGQRIKVYVLDVRRTSKGPEILVSRAHKDMLRRLFEIEVPEVYNGVVEIKAIAREAGFRSKVGVISTQEGIDPVGSCIGVRGNRIQSIVNELQGEKIDVVSWDDDPKHLISKALSPSEVIHVEIYPSTQTATVVVPDRQLSLAIGREGQNARLAARLTGWRLDIKGITEWEEIKGTRANEQQIEDNQAAIEPTALKDAVAVKPDHLGAEATEIVEEAAAALTIETDAVLAQEAPNAPALDEAALLEALMQEEVEAAQQANQEQGDAGPGLSVEELETFTFDNSFANDEEDGEKEAGESLLDPLDGPVLTPDAGKIRFAEDLLGETRGTSRGGRRARRNVNSGAQGKRRAGSHK